MAIQAVIFDIGGVPENNPETGWPAVWAASLGIDPATFDRLVSEGGEPGSIGALRLEEIEQRTAIDLGIDGDTVPSSWRTCGRSTWAL